MKKRSGKTRLLQGVTLGQVFLDTWNDAPDKESRRLVLCLAFEYLMHRTEPAPDERAKIGLAWGAVKREIDRLRDSATDAVANGEGDGEGDSEKKQNQKVDGEGESEGAGESPAAPDSPSRSRSKTYRLDREEVWQFFRANDELVANSDRFVDWWNAGGWRQAADPSDWKSSARNWAAHEWGINPALKKPENETMLDRAVNAIRAYYNDPLRHIRYWLPRKLAEGKVPPEKLRASATKWLVNHGIPQDEAEKEVAKLSGGSAGDTARPQPSYDARPHIPTMAEVASARWSVPESAEERYGNEVTEIPEAADPPRTNVVGGYPVILSPEERWGRRTDIIDGYRIPKFDGLDDEAAAFRARMQNEEAAARRARMEEQNAEPKPPASPSPDEQTAEPTPTTEPGQPKDLSRSGRDKSRDKSHAVRDKSHAARDKNDHATPRAKGKATRRPSGRRSAAGGKKEKR